MRRLILVGLLALSVAAPAAADTYVRGYTRSDGTYVQPHMRTNPNSNSFDNYSTRGNVNPYTGQMGTHSPYGSQSPYSSGSSGFGSYGTQPRTPCYGLNCR